MADTPKRKPGRPGLAKGDWLEAALVMLARDSVADLTIEGLARSLKTSKSGFYWHFRDRGDLLDELLAHWRNEFTEIVAGNPKVAKMSPIDRLNAIALMIIDYDLARYEVAMQQWALQDPSAAEIVNKVNERRTEYVRQAFSELGFRGGDLEMRTRVFACYCTWESVWYPGDPRAFGTERKKMIPKYVAMLTKK